MFKRAIIFSVIVSFVLPLSVKAKKKDDDQPQDVGELSVSVATQGKNLATLTNQVNEMVGNFQNMNGDIGRNFKKIKDQDRVIKDSSTRLQILEDQISILTGQLQELQTEGLLSPQSSKRLNEYKDYARGLEYVNAKDYDKAIKEFERFKTENKKSIFNSYAQFWIGESYYMQADYPMAVKQYQKLLAKNSKSAKAPTALYRQGLSFYNLNSFDDAKAFFSKVIKTYPRSIEAIQANSQIKRINTILALRKQQELEMKMIQ